jgi:6-pyruvoyl-tetrahydropterin synthase
MAEIGIIEKFHAAHGTKSHEHDFKVEIILEGKIDPKTEFALGIDHYQVISEVKKIISEIENKNLKEILSKLGYKSSCNESIARFFLQKLRDKFPVKCVKIMETESRYATLYSNEL